MSDRIEAVVRAGGATIRYLRAGCGPPVVLLMGERLEETGESSLFAELAKRFRVIAPELPPEAGGPRGDAQGRSRTAWLRDLPEGLGLGHPCLVVAAPSATVRSVLEGVEGRFERIVVVGPAAAGADSGAVVETPCGVPVHWLDPAVEAAEGEEAAGTADGERLERLLSARPEERAAPTRGERGPNWAGGAGGALGVLAVAVTTLLASACASTGSTFGSGVGDSYLESPPYYAGARPAAVATVALGHLPIAYQRGATQPAAFDPSVSEPMETLLARMNGFLDSLQVSVKLVEGGSVSAVAHAATRFPPDVHFGCATPSLAPDDACISSASSARARPVMRLAVGRPSAAWVEWIERVMADVGVERVLVVTLEVGQYVPRQRGLLGNKVVELGTSHTMELPWLTSLDTPATVLQLTGAVVGSGGRAMRIGAEGLLARPPNLILSAAGAQTLIADDDVRALLDARRNDLPGAPLVWEEALRTLVAQLTGRIQG